MGFPQSEDTAGPVASFGSQKTSVDSLSNHDCNPGFARSYSIDEPKLRERYLDELIAASASLQGRLANHPSEQARAVGLVLSMLPLRHEDAREFELQWNPCDAEYVPEFKGISAAQCADRKRLAKERALGFYQRSMAEPMLRLAALAAQTKDPVVYAQGLAACNVGRMYSTPTAAACSQLSLGRWAQLDPDNMEPWLQLANQAAQKSDELAWMDAAMRAGQAQRRQTYRETPALRISELIFADSSDAELHAATAGTETLLSLTIQQWRDPWAWLQPCSSAKVADGNRRQMCEALAHTVLKNASSLNDSLEAIMLGKRLGWPQEKVKSIGREHGILQHLALRAYGEWDFETGKPIVESEENEASCSALRTKARRKLRLLGMNQFDIARHQLKESGKTMVQAEAEMLDFQKKLQQQFNPAPASAPAR